MLYSRTRVLQQSSSTSTLAAVVTAAAAAMISIPRKSARRYKDCCCKGHARGCLAPLRKPLPPRVRFARTHAPRVRRQVHIYVCVCTPPGKRPERFRTTIVIGFLFSLTFSLSLSLILCVSNTHRPVSGIVAFSVVHTIIYIYTL